MAELLVKLQANYINKNITKNNVGVYQRGDVIVVMPDGHRWGKEEHPKTTTYNPPRCAIVKIPSMSVSEAKKYIQSEIDETDILNPIIKKRRLFKFDIDSMDIKKQNDLRDNGEVLLTSINLKSLIKNKVTGIKLQI